MCIPQFPAQHSFRLGRLILESSSLGGKFGWLKLLCKFSPPPRGGGRRENYHWATAVETKLLSLPLSVSPSLSPCISLSSSLSGSIFWNGFPMEAVCATPPPPCHAPPGTVATQKLGRCGFAGKNFATFWQRGLSFQRIF